MNGKSANNRMRMTRFAICILTGLQLAASPVELALAADDQPARLLYVVTEDDKIIASNVLFSRSDEFRLSAQEKVDKQLTDNAVLVVATNRRLIGYSVYTASWVTISLKAGEFLEEIQAEDYSAFAVTSKRVLNFNGRAGQWTETRR
ncbi:MAG: hypothetical protein ACR2QU_11280 [Gammaproteobacteria bacterium]